MVYVDDFEITGIMYRGMKMCRMKAGDNIRIEAGQIVHETLENPATHFVIGCYGTINSSTLSVMLQNIDTKNFEIFKIQ